MPRTPKRQEHASSKQRGSGTHVRQDLTGHDIGSRTSKSSSLPEELDNRILKGYCGAKEFSKPGPLYTEVKAHAEEEEAPED